jgi:hypothetical protein
MTTRWVNNSELVARATKVTCDPDRALNHLQYLLWDLPPTMVSCNPSGNMGTCGGCQEAYSREDAQAGNGLYIGDLAAISCSG